MHALYDSNGLNPNLTANITVDLRNKLLEFPRTARALLKKQAKSKGSYDTLGRTLVILQRATQMNPDQFIAWAAKQARKDPVTVQDKLDDIATQLKPSDAYNFKNYTRGLLKANGVPLTTADNTYTNKTDHPEYKKEDINKLLTYIPDKRHKLYVHIIAESGLRPHNAVKLEIRHIKEDLDTDTIPTAIRLDPEDYTGKKLAGHTFLGTKTIQLLKECQQELGPKGEPLIGSQPKSRLVPLEYSTLNEILRNAKRKARLNEQIQPAHGLRKYFEYALDKAGIDHDLKMRIEGHNNGTRGKAYTTRDWDELREQYRIAYPHINIDDPTDTAIAKTIAETENDVKQLQQKIKQLEAERDQREADLKTKWQALRNDVRQIIREEEQLWNHKFTLQDVERNKQYRDEWFNKTEQQVINETLQKFRKNKAEWEERQKGKTAEELFEQYKAEDAEESQQPNKSHNG